MHFNCRSFIGKNDSQNWSQYWENEPDDFQIKSQKGHLFGLINIKSNSDQDIDLVQTGHNLISKINQSYFYGSDQDVISNLKLAADTINHPDYFNLQIDLVLLVVLDQEVFIVSFGPNQVILSRGSNISSLIKGDQEIKTISGPVQPTDRLFITNQNFFDKITWEKIKNILFDENIQNIEENFLSQIYSCDDQSNLSAVLIETNSDISQPTDLNSPTEDQVVPSPVENQLKPIFIENQPSHQTSKRKKIQIIVSIFLLLGLFVSSYFGYQKNQKINNENKYQQLKSDLQKQLDNISLVKSMNLEAAQTGAKESQKIVEQMSSLNIHSDEVSQFQSEINLLLSQTGVNENFTPDVFFDTSLITSNPQYKDIFLNQNKIYLLDSSSGRVDSLNITDKSNKNIIIDQKINSSSKVFGDANNLYLLFSDNISQINSSSIDKKISFSDSEINPTATDASFWNGAIYLLDSNNQNILKFSPNSDGFSQPQNWLKNDKKLDFGAISLSIDGKIWVLYQNGLIDSFVSGVKDNFKLSGDNQINQANKLVVDLSDDGHIIFVDNQNLVFVYKKSGDFVAKYNLGQLKVVDLSIDKNIIYLLASDQKIYKINL